jgi:diacylglycerol kinase family enzyme
VLVFLNPRAGHGRGITRWKRARPLIEERTGGLDLVEIESFEGLADAVRTAVDAGERVLVAAGGDGTVNLVLHAIMLLGVEGRSADLVLGAVGLGSSNDFHKPHRAGSFIGGVPVRLDCVEPQPHDVIRVDLEDAEGHRATRYAIMNASLGITAEANAAFTESTGVIRAVSRASVDAGIVASVLRTLAAYRDIQCRIAIDDAEEGSFAVSNLGVIKNPHFAGSFCYDTLVEPADGRLGVNLCEGLTRFQVLATLAALSRGRFTGRPKTRSWVCERVSVEGDRTFALETDGEVVRATRAEFSVCPKAIRCCR